MEYENGNINLSEIEKALMKWLTDGPVEEPMPAQFYIYAMERLKQDIASNLLKFKSDPDFEKNELKVRFAMELMMNNCDRLRENAIALVASEGGDELVFDYN
jgi:hypothetical protein